MIRALLLMAVVLSFSCPASAVAVDTPALVVMRQEIEVTLKPAEHLLIGASTLTIAAGQRHLSLQLSPAAMIESVAVSGVKLPYSFSGGNLSLEVPRTDGRDAVAVTVSYRTVYNDPLPLNSGTSEDPTYGVRGAITTRGTFLGEAADWYPTPASLPRMRSVRVFAPAGTEAITSGKRVKRSTNGIESSSFWEELRPVGVLTLCAGPYRIEERREGGVDLYTYFYPENASLAARYLDAASQYLRLYTELFGVYPFEKFAVVENFFPTGYGFPSFTLLGSSIIRLPFILDTSFPHEIAHSWWGNAIEVDQSQGNWAEGLVTYLADYLLKEQRSPAEGREYRLQLLSEFSTLVTRDADFPLSRFISRGDPVSRTIGYGKSAMLFHMIRTKIGDRAFFGALRDIYRERRYQSATWGDFERAFSRSSGGDLSVFMKQWLNRSGGPRVVLSDVTSRREGQGWTVSGSVVQTPPVYELQVPLRLETDGPPISKTIPLTGTLSGFTLFSPSEPRQLLLDPEADIFRVLSPAEIPVTVNSIKSSHQLLAVVTEDCRATDVTFRRLLESLGKGGATVIREDELDAEQLRTHDLMFCGIPLQRSLLPPLPSGIGTGANGFSVDGKDSQAPDGLLFLVLSSHASAGRIRVLYRPLSETAAAQYSPKITHYGKFGALAFSGGVNRHKSTVAQPGGGNRVDF